ncbi:glycosyltransferase family 2 protein [Vibrio fluvialis]|nr:glycosyltransferase family 2 protein [Vibrio fluvialis]MBY8093633.1 glycosyltransferase family 2 protein [Vibrio fluvialis]
MGVSVIITTKDRPDFLFRAIDSVAKQSVKPLEIIVIDDCSSVKIDEAVVSEYIDKLKSLDIYFHYHYNNVGMGGNYSRNLGAEKSKNNILMFLDDDDYWLEDKIKTQVACIDDQHELVYTGKQFVYSNDLDHVYRKSKENTRCNSLWKGNYIGTTSGVAITKVVFVKAGGFDENLKSLQDYDLWVRILQLTKAKWDLSHNILYTVHKSTGKQISSDPTKHIDSVSRIREKYSNIIHGLDDDEKMIFESRMYHLIARAYRKNNDLIFVKFLFKSMICKPSLRTLSLFFKY